MNGSPDLTVVATARNDNHGGDLLRRMQVFVNSLAAQAERHAVSTELLLVEWNPPPDRPRLTRALQWPEPAEFFESRVIEVPSSLHATIEHSDRLPLFQMLAKNVGIRRARGRFVLATNVDLIFSDELMAALGAGAFGPDAYYRTDRHDVDFPFDPDEPIDALLQKCAAHTIRVCGREGTRDLRTGEFFRIYSTSIFPKGFRYIPDGLRHAWLPIRFFLFTTYYRLRYAVRFVLARLIGRRRRYAYRSLGRRLVGRDPLPPLPPPPRPKPRYGELTGFRESAAHWWGGLVRLWHWERARLRLHTNGCGDFTLMSKDAWFRLRGYPELHVFSMHLDSLLLYQAHYQGLREEHIPHPIFHLEHAAGFRPDSEGVRTLNEKLDRAGIPQISFEDFMDYTIELWRERGAFRFNNEDWGLADAHLPETPTAVADASLSASIP